MEVPVEILRLGIVGPDEDAGTRAPREVRGEVFEAHLARAAVSATERARLTHWAPPLGHSAQALLGIGLHDMRRGNETRHPPFEASAELALGAMALGATLQTTPPQPTNGVAERVERRTVARHPVVAETVSPKIMFE